MIDKIQIILSKNVVLCGGTPEDRQRCISQAKDAFVKRFPSARVFTLSENIGDIDRYLKSVKKEFPIQPSDKNKNALGQDQLNDSYLDWVDKEKNVLVIIPEVQKLFKSNPTYFYQVMGDYMAKQQFLKAKVTLRFLATSSEVLSIDVNRVPVLIGGDWRPSAKDLEVISL